MELINIIFLVMGLIAGFIFGVKGMLLTYYSGWLNVIKDTDDGPYFYLEFEKHPTEVIKKGYVLLKLKDQSRKINTLKWGGKNYGT